MGVSRQTVHWMRQRQRINIFLKITETEYGCCCLNVTNDSVIPLFQPVLSIHIITVHLVRSKQSPSTGPLLLAKQDLQCVKPYNFYDEPKLDRVSVQETGCAIF